MKILRAFLMASLFTSVSLGSYALIAEEDASNEAASAPELPKSGDATGVVVLVKDGSKITAASVIGTKYGEIEVPASLFDKYKALNDMTVKFKFEEKDGKLVASSAPIFLGPNYKRLKNSLP